MYTHLKTTQSKKDPDWLLHFRVSWTYKNYEVTNLKFSYLPFIQASYSYLYTINFEFTKLETDNYK